ncbi:hypothetical protein EYF80_026405 [Liparis tanakae]|uniref:Uncharacterized protein n=1 Tax=Liparis tanakae TaxID=230148 RepID=A0A4Z2HEG7_9TELE|nr:hypothetical protein EYF80_026405 [Liparis tanakae]
MSELMRAGLWPLSLGIKREHPHPCTRQTSPEAAGDHPSERESIPPSTALNRSVTALPSAPPIHPAAVHLSGSRLRPTDGPLLCHEMSSFVSTQAV